MRKPGTSVKRAQDLTLRLLVPPISEPAENKYTKVDACVRSVPLISRTSGLLRKALGVRLKKEAAESDCEPDHCDADAAIGIPRDEQAYYKEAGHLRLQKIYTFLSHGHAKYMLLVWLAVVQPIMIMHYFLFKHGTWYPYRDFAADISIFDFCGGTQRNRVAVLVGSLASMLLDPAGLGRPYLRLLRLKLGDRIENDRPCKPNGGEVRPDQSHRTTVPT